MICHLPVRALTQAELDQRERDAYARARELFKVIKVEMPWIITAEEMGEEVSRRLREQGFY